MKRFVLLVFAYLLIMSATSAQDGGSLRLPIPEDRPVGLTVDTREVQDGYILLPIIQSSSTWLLSNDGRIVHSWPGEYNGASFTPKSFRNSIAAGLLGTL